MPCEKLPETIEEAIQRQVLEYGDNCGDCYRVIQKWLHEEWAKLVGDTKLALHVVAESTSAACEIFGEALSETRVPQRLCSPRFTKDVDELDFKQQDAEDYRGKRTAEALKKIILDTLKDVFLAFSQIPEVRLYLLPSIYIRREAYMVEFFIWLEYQIDKPATDEK